MNRRERNGSSLCRCCTSRLAMSPTPFVPNRTLTCLSYVPRETPINGLHNLVPVARVLCRGGLAGVGFGEGQIIASGRAFDHSPVFLSKVTSLETELHAYSHVSCLTREKRKRKMGNVVWSPSFFFPCSRKRSVKSVLLLPLKIALTRVIIGLVARVELLVPKPRWQSHSTGWWRDARLSRTAVLFYDGTNRHHRVWRSCHVCCWLGFFDAIVNPQ